MININYKTRNRLRKKSQSKGGKERGGGEWGNTWREVRLFCASTNTQSIPQYHPQAKPPHNPPPPPPPPVLHPPPRLPTPFLPLTTFTPPPGVVIFISPN